MSIEKRGGQWYYRFQFRGAEQRSPTGLAATRENQTAAKELEKQAKAKARLLGNTGATSSVPFTLAAAEFISWCENVEYRASPSTARRIETSFRSAVEFWKDTLVRDIGPIQIEKYKEHRAQAHQVKDITIRHDLYALQIFFNRFAIKRGWAESNPLADVSKPSDKDAIRIYILTTEEEARYFMQAAKNPTLHDLARLIIEQGCRPEELLALRPGDVDIERNKLHIRGGKTRAARRTLALTAESAAILSRRKEKHDTWIFPGLKPGQHIVKVNGAHDKACLDAGLSFVLYDLRHTFATRLLVDVGVDVATVAALLGHSGLRAVAKYLHPQEQAKTEAMRKYDLARAKGKSLKLVRGSGR